MPWRRRPTRPPSRRTSAGGTWRGPRLATWQGDPSGALDIVQAAFGDPRLPSIDASIGSLAALGLGAAADILESEPAGSPRSVAAQAAGEAIHQRIRRLRRSGLLTPPDLPTAGPGERSGPATAKVALVEAEASRLTGRGSVASWRRLVLAAEAEERLPLVAYGRYRLGAALLAGQGDREQATSAIRDAHTMAVGLGARPLASMVEALARRARISLVASGGAAEVAGSPYGLTERELEVLELVVAGHSNREIGAALFISPKTASVHVSNILAKLGVDGRVEAATMALRLGIVGPSSAARAPSRA